MRGNAAYDASVGGLLVENAGGRQPVGGVSPVPGASRFAQLVRFTLNNTTPGVVRYFIGSPLAKALSGNAALADPDGASNDLIGVLRSFEVMPVLVRSLHFTTSSDRQQFQQGFSYGKGSDIDGSNQGTSIIPLALAGRPTYQDDLQLILEAEDIPWRMGQLEYMTIDVLPGEQLDVTMQLAALLNR